MKGVIKIMVFSMINDFDELIIIIFPKVYNLTNENILINYLLLHSVIYIN